MKIVEDSSSRLVLRESGIKNKLGGILFAAMAVLVFLLGLREHRSLITIGAAVFFVLGIYMFITAQSDTVIADKLSRQLSVRFKSLRKRAGPTQTYSFADVAAVQLTQQYSQQYFADGDGAPGSTLNVGGVGLAGNVQTFIETNVIIQMKSGALLTIADEQKQAGLRVGASNDTLMSLGQKLATVLGVPFQVVGATSPGQAAQVPTGQDLTQPSGVAAQPGVTTQGSPSQGLTDHASTPAGPADHSA